MKTIAIFNGTEKHRKYINYIIKKGYNIQNIVSIPSNTETGIPKDISIHFMRQESYHPDIINNMLILSAIDTGMIIACDDKAFQLVIPTDVNNIDKLIQTINLNTKLSKPLGFEDVKHINNVLTVTKPI